jgi:hypothetical protein
MATFNSSIMQVENRCRVPAVAMKRDFGERERGEERGRKEGRRRKEGEGGRGRERGRGRMRWREEGNGNEPTKIKKPNSKGRLFSN